MNQLGFLEDNPYANKNYHNFTSTYLLPRHRWYYFKEGFSAHLVKEAISQVATRCNRRLNILDPFCGSGTTALTASLSGHHCTSIEVNPFLAFVAQVKMTTDVWDRKNFDRVLDTVVNQSLDGAYSHLEEFSTFCEKPGLDKWLFNRSVLRRFTSLMIYNSKQESDFQDAFKLAAIVAALECSNARRDGKALRYKKNWKELHYSSREFMQGFFRAARMMMDDVESYPIKPEDKPEILSGDVRKVLPALSVDEYDLVITSPPYLNSLDYSDVYRPELFLGEFVKNNDELAKIRMETVRSHIQVNWSPHILFESNLLQPIIEQLSNRDDLWNNRIPLMVKAYFDDMWQVLTAVYKRLRRYSQVWIVVSTSAYGGIKIPVDSILADLAIQIGFEVDSINHLRHLRTSGQQWKQLNTIQAPLKESLLILTKR